MKKILTLVALCAALNLNAQSPFTQGNLVVARIGDGTTPTIAGSSNYFPVALQEFTPAGVLVQTIPLNSATSGSQLTISGQLLEVSLNLSANKNYLSLLGYDAGPTNNGTTRDKFSKVVGRVDVNGVVDYTTKTKGDANIVSQITSVDGSNFWFGSFNSGVRYVPYGNKATTAPTIISAGTAANSVKAVDIFNGQLYGMGINSNTPTLYSIGTGLPTTAATNTPLAGSLPTGSQNNNGFVFFDVGNTGSPNLLYTCDGTIIRKYTYSTTPINYVSGFTVTNPGSGYTSAPKVTLSNGQGAIATIGTTPSPITGIYTWSPNNNSSAPTVTITGGGGTGATATATLTSGPGWVYNGFVGIGTVSGVTVTGGVGYTVAPTVVFTGGNGGGATATATLDGNGSIIINVTNPGSKYTSVPTVTLTGGTFTTAATATAVLHGGNSAGLTGNLVNGKAQLYTTVFQGNGATGSNNSAFLKIVDNNSVGAAPSTTNTLLATPASNYHYRGVAFAPISALPTPVKFIFFNATQTSSKVLLDWATASELNVANFEIERSEDGINYAQIGKQSAVGTTSKEQHYHFVDAETNLTGTIYYRLKTVDKDGSFAYSAVKKVELNLTQSYIANVYPNPLILGQNLKIKYVALKADKITFSLVDYLGKSVKEMAKTVSKGTNELSLSVAHLAAGTYYLTTNNSSAKKQIVIIQ